MDIDEVLYAGAVAQAQLIRDGKLGVCELVEATLARIDRVNPHVNAFRIVLAEHALAAAAEADAHRAADRDLPLFGVPVAIKDDADVAGEVTAWGTDAFGPPKRVDSEVVARLRAAGAIVVGKTNVPEMTLWPWTASKTWGLTANPFDIRRTPGGSSGGSAAAVATGMCGVALGSDGGGSIRYPSALTGLFGLKPQRDRVSLGPDHHDAWNGLTVYGPLARTVRDAAAFLDVTAGQRPADGFGAVLDAPFEARRIAMSFKPPFGSLARLADEQRTALEDTAQLLRALGHDVFERKVDYGFDVMWNGSVRYLTGVAHDVTGLPRAERLEQSTRRLVAIARRFPRAWLTSARKREGAIAARMNRSFDRADVVLTPMAGGPAPLITDVAGHGLARSLYRSNAAAWAVPWNVIGQPAASVPAGVDAHGLPIAVQLCGRRSDEATLLQIAAQIEEARPWADCRPLPTGR